MWHQPHSSPDTLHMHKTCATWVYSGGGDLIFVEPADIFEKVMRHTTKWLPSAGLVHLLRVEMLLTISSERGGEFSEHRDIRKAEFITKPRVHSCDEHAWNKLSQLVRSNSSLMIYFSLFPFKTSWILSPELKKQASAHSSHEYRAGDSLP